jgi:hypothetical protein
MELRKFIKTTIREYLNENRSSISKIILPNYLYHVTTNYNKVINSGVLLAKSGLDSGGLGGTESFGVSFVTNLDIAKNIKDELTLINKINNSTNEKEILETINNIDEERKQFILNEYNRTIDVYKRFDYAALMAIRLSRNSLKFSNKPFYGLVIFHEENIKNKDIGIIKINKNSIPDDVDIIEGVDKDLGEIRVLGNISL